MSTEQNEFKTNLAMPQNQDRFSESDLNAGGEGGYTATPPNRNTEGAKEILKGKRNITLFKMALNHLRKGHDLISTSLCIRDHNICHCSPPLEDTEINSISGRAYEFYLKSSKTEGQISDSDKYIVKDGCLCQVIRTPKGVSHQPLCNFVAIIIKEIIRDDGNNLFHSLIIKGIGKDGDEFQEIEIPSESFQFMNWVSKWGPKAIIFPGYICKDNVRTAIQELSSDHKRVYEYIHTGWRYIDGENYYLTSGGAIGRNGFNENIMVNLADSQLQNFVLPCPPTSQPLIDAIKASMSIIDGDIPHHVSFPIFSSIYRAAIGNLKEINFTMMVVGMTGVMKTTLVGLCNAHFGKFDDLNITESWVSTANSLERKAHIVKDSWFLVDDYVPGESNEKVVDYMIRGQGNRAGRARMRADGSLRVTNSPRCLLITTGEDAPIGQSLRSRMMIIDIKKGDVTTDEINRIKAQHHLFSPALSGFVSWLSKRYEEKKASVPRRFEELRKRFMKFKCHQRVTSTVADLLVGLEEFLEYAVESGAMTGAEAFNLFENRAIPAMERLIDIQNQYHEVSDPVDIFITNIRSALITGKAHLKAKGNRVPSNPEKWGWKLDRDVNWITSGDHIGWISNDEIWLQPEAAFNMANRLAPSQASRIHIHRDSLWSRMADRGLLVISYGESKNTIKRQVDSNRRPRVIVLRDLSLFQNDLDHSDMFCAPIAPLFQPSLQSSNIPTVAKNEMLQGGYSIEDLQRIMRENVLAQLQDINEVKETKWKQ